MFCSAEASLYNVQPKEALLLPSGVGSPGGKLGAKGSVTDGQRWDTWGRLTQSLFSTVPHMATIGACLIPLSWSCMHDTLQNICIAPVQVAPHLGMGLGHLRSTSTLA